MNRSKMIGFWEDVVPTLEDEDFRRYFRMNKQTLLSLYDYLSPKWRIYQGGRSQVNPRKAVAMTVCFLGCQLPFKQISGFFSISERCLIEVTNHVMGLLVDKSKNLIKWPDKEEFPAIAAEFDKKRFRYSTYKQSEIIFNMYLFCTKS